MQPTVSRDIAQLGLVKVRARDGRLVYALPDASDLDRLAEPLLGPPAVGAVADAEQQPRRHPDAAGVANALAQTIDDARHADIVGTVAGDNTIIVIAREGLRGAELAEELHHHLEGEK